MRNLLFIATSLLILSGCIAGGGGSEYVVTKEINKGGIILIKCVISEYGNDNVDKSIQPVIIQYKVNDGKFAKVSDEIKLTNQKNAAVYDTKITIDEKMVKPGDKIITEFRYNWHGTEQIRTDITVVK